MKAEELRKLAPEELAQKARETRDDLFNVRVKQATGQLENTARMNSLRRDVARIETVLREKSEASQ